MAEPVSVYQRRQLWTAGGIDRNGNQEQQHIYYFHTNLKGMSEELTDEAGEIVWECSYQLWGKPVQKIAHREIQQNLRYQRQYSDRENGLTKILQML